MWRGIIANVECLHNSGIIPLNAIRRLVRNGEATEFWHHVWCGDNRLATVFPRLYRLATNMHAKVADYRGEDGWQFQWRVPIRGGVIEEHIEHLHLQVEHIQLVDGVDSWRWDVGNDDSFSVRSARTHIDFASLPSSGLPVRWCKYLPRKVNVFLWRLQHKRLPTRGLQPMHYY